MLSGSFFITQGDASAIGWRIVILKIPGLKTHFAKNQFKLKKLMDKCLRPTEEKPLSIYLLLTFSYY